MKKPYLDASLLIKLLDLPDNFSYIKDSGLDSLRDLFFFEMIKDFEVDDNAFIHSPAFKDYQRLIFSGIWKIQSCSTAPIIAFGRELVVPKKQWIWMQLLPAWQITRQYQISSSALMLMFFMYHKPSRIQLNKIHEFHGIVKHIKSQFLEESLCNKKKVFPDELFDLRGIV